MFDVGAINTLIVWRELLALRDDASTAHILCEHTESRSSTLMRDLAIQLCDVQSVTQLVTPHAATLERQLSQSHPLPSLGEGQHLVRRIKPRTRCAYARCHDGKHSRVRTGCDSCNVALCLDCFIPYHRAQESRTSK